MQNELTMNWNNQIRACNASLAIAAYKVAKGEQAGPDEDDITNLIIDLLHLKALVSEEDLAGVVIHAGEVAIAEEENDRSNDELIYERWPTNGIEQLHAWQLHVRELTRPLLVVPPRSEG